MINLFKKIKCFSSKPHDSFISCQFGYKRLYFFNQKVCYCSNGNSSKNRQLPVIYNDFNGELNIDDLAKKINQVRKKAARGVIPQCCEGCSLVKDVYKNEKSQRYPKLEYVQFSDYSLCNSKCVYCNSWKSTKIVNGKIPIDLINNDSYNIKPIIETLISKKMITQNTVVDFAGGEPTVYRFFDESIDLLLQNGVKQIEIFSNIIKYSDTIAKGISLGVINLTVSLDAGTKEIHAKVKGVESFDFVYNNLQKYSNLKINDEQITSKYVIVPNVNDIDSEILIWIKKSISIGVKKLMLNADNRILEEEINTNIVLKIKYLSSFFTKTCHEFGIKYDLGSNINFINSI